MILSDFDLRAYLNSGRLKIEPLDPLIIRENGLDLRLGRSYCELKETLEVLDPYNDWDPDKFYECREGDEYVLKPGRKYLLHTIEYIALPPELVGIVELRSTLARLGLLIPPTVVDGGFEGQLTIEVHSSSFPIKLRSGSRFLHLILMKTTTPIERPYRGRYQGQRNIMLPKRPLEYP
ncbi:MAG: dCTP deaminase [Sulfolobales archaeon]